RVPIIQPGKTELLFADWLVTGRLEAGMWQQHSQRRAASASQGESRLFPFLIHFEVVSSNRADHTIQQHFVIRCLIRLPQQAQCPFAYWPALVYQQERAQKFVACQLVPWGKFSAYHLLKSFIILT